MRQPSAGSRLKCRHCTQALVSVLLAGALAVPALHASSPQDGPASASVLQEYVATGSAALARGDNALAESAFRKALSLAPDSVPLLNNLALSLARQNRSPEAIGFYRQALALKPGDAVTERNLGVAYYRAHRYEEAGPFLEHVATTAPSFQSLELAGLNLFATDRYSEAAAYLERARALSPDDLNTLNMLGQAYLRSKNYIAMTEIFTRIMAIHPDSAEAHVMLATAYDKLFREQDSIREFQAAEQVDSHYPGVHTGLGVIYWRTDQTALAKHEFELALQQTPTDPVANCTMGRILRREGKLHEAIEYFEAALAANKSYQDALREIGQSWIALQEPAKALVSLRRAEVLDPEDAETHYILGTALRETGQPAEGNRERAKAAQLLSQQHTTSSAASRDATPP